jgi:hypothetical protein
MATLERQTTQHLDWFIDLIKGTASTFDPDGDHDRYVEHHCFSFLMHPASWQIPTGSPEINSDRVFHQFRSAYLRVRQRSPWENLQP